MRQQARLVAPRARLGRHDGARHQIWRVRLNQQPVERHRTYGVRKRLGAPLALVTRPPCEADVQPEVHEFAHLLRAAREAVQDERRLKPRQQRRQQLR